MINNFEKLRKKLHDSIDKNGMDSEKTRKISTRFNDLVSSYYKNEKQFRQDNFMTQKYIESMKHLRKITREFAKFPTVEEWNKYAKENNLISSESIKYMSGNNWHNLRNRILSEI